jgi:SAM-dependent methyltransferase
VSGKTRDNKQDLDGQQPYWDKTFADRADMFGEAASDPASAAASLFAHERRFALLELGAGQGRDTLFFAERGFRVTALDYSRVAVDAIAAKAEARGLGGRVTALQHDVRQPLPFANESFDACYSHMLYCMALRTPEIETLSADIRRVLAPRGLNVYTLRHTTDAHYRSGLHRGEDMYEVGGFIVHFFTRDEVERLTEGWELLSIDEFEEGGLPRRLFRVTLRKS